MRGRNDRKAAPACHLRGISRDAVSKTNTAFPPIRSQRPSENEASTKLEHGIDPTTTTAANTEPMPHPLQLPFRDAMSACAAGVHVVTTNGAAGRHGITMTAVTPVTDEPPTVMLCINRQSAIVPVLQQNRAACINILAAHQQDIAEHFAGLTTLSLEERFEYHIWHRGRSGQLQIEGALAHLHGRTAAQNQVGSHTVFMIEIDEIAVPPAQPAEAPALVYFRRRFAALP